MHVVLLLSASIPAFSSPGFKKTPFPFNSLVFAHVLVCWWVGRFWSVLEIPFDPQAELPRTELLLETMRLVVHPQVIETLLHTSLAPQLDASLQDFVA